MTSREFVDTLEKRFRRRRVTQRDEVIHSDDIHLRFDVPGSKQCFDFGREGKDLINMVVKKRFLTYVIPSEKETATTLIPNRERKHPAEVTHALSPVLLIEMDYNFGVRGGLEAVTRSLESLPELRKIVDLAVENDPNGLVFVGKRLPSSIDVDNAEAPVPESDSGVKIVSFVVRAPMRKRGVH
jgi:hypothetical protein